MTATPETELTTVVFRKWSGQAGGTVIALFPEIPGDSTGLTCSSYEHVGQHGNALYNHVLSRTRPADQEEYAALKAELESEPYNYRLKVVARSTAKHVCKRFDSIR